MNRAVATVVVVLAVLALSGCSDHGGGTDAEQTLDRALHANTLGYPDDSAVRLQISARLTNDVRGCEFVDLGVGDMEVWDVTQDDAGDTIVTIRVTTSADSCTG